MGTFQKYLPWACWVKSGRIVSEPPMYSQCTRWVNDPSPPVSLGLYGKQQTVRPDKGIPSYEMIRSCARVYGECRPVLLIPLIPTSSSVQHHPFVVNVSNTSTAFTVRYLSFPCCDGLTPPPQFTTSTRTYVCHIQSTAGDEEKAVQEGRGKHCAPLCITSHLCRNVSPSLCRETLPLRRCSLPPHHHPFSSGMPSYLADSR